MMTLTVVSLLVTTLARTPSSSTSHGDDDDDDDNDDDEEEDECVNEDLNLFVPKTKGIPNTDCSFYEKKSAAAWLPDAYLVNAFCACSTTPDCPSARCVREYLQLVQAAADGSLRERATTYMSSNTPFDRTVRYELLAQTEIVDYVYDIHVDAYQVCGCPAPPTPLWAWRFVVALPPLLGCDFIGDSINLSGPCHGIPGEW